MITQPSILAATADSLWPNTAACCRAVRPGSSGVVRHYRCATASSRAAAPQSRASQVSRCAANTRHRGVKGRTALTPRAFNGEYRVERWSYGGGTARRYRALQPPRLRGCRIANTRECARVKKKNWCCNWRLSRLRMHCIHNSNGEANGQSW